jgi:hypothetical protein
MEAPITFRKWARKIAGGGRTRFPDLHWSQYVLDDINITPDDMFDHIPANKITNRFIDAVWTMTEAHKEAMSELRRLAPSEDL